MGAGVLGGTAITKSEIDIWYNQHLTCLANLNKWTDVLADIKIQITTDDAPDEPDYKCLWEPEKEIYLELFLKGAIKVSTYHSAVTEFVQLCNDDLPKKSRLINEYSTHLATLTVINKEWDRARFVLGQCYKVFRRRWSALHPLALGARHQHIRLLQKTLELDEFVSFVSNPHWNELPRFLSCSSTCLCTFGSFIVIHRMTEKICSFQLQAGCIINRFVIFVSEIF